mmetsp:Transcript_64157/g.121557  ORF Transcript_64157/g.121557 Transcript_64157/m.121557 type:complete len:433 (-) Transcript_64157:51-1349(-)
MDGDQLHRMLRMLSQIQALSNDPDAAGLVQSGALLATVLEQVLAVPRAPPMLAMRMDSMEGPSGMSVLVPMSAFFPLLLQQGLSASRQRGLAERALSRLPEIAITSETLERVRSSNGGEALCAICHEDYQIGKKLMQLPCEHMFCVDCGREWLQRSNTCPVCRNEVQEEEDEGAGSSSDGGWHTEELFPFRFPQGSPLAAVRGARQAQSSTPLELWPPVDEVSRIAEQHSAWPSMQEDASTGSQEHQRNAESQTRASGPAVESNPVPRRASDSSPSRSASVTSTDHGGGSPLPTTTDATSSPGRETPVRGSGRTSTTPVRQERQPVRNPNAQSRSTTWPRYANAGGPLGASGSRTSSTAFERIRSSTGQVGLLPSVARNRGASLSSMRATTRAPRSDAGAAMTRSISSNMRLATAQGAPARALRRSSASGPR